MLSIALKALPALIAAGGVYASTQETNPLIDYAKAVMVQYEMSTMSRFITYNAIGKNIVPTSRNFTEYLRESMQSSRDPALDMWDEPYIFERDGRDCAVVSKGPDKKRGTEDDIRVEFQLPF